jgi:glyoxylase-like metal-dependent hydrolase (beta-lactamase superfamily II)
MSDWEPIGPGIWKRQYPPFRMNVGLVLGDSECLLIDTRATEREGWDLRLDVSTVTSLPISDVVNTHAHFDHCFGNAAFTDARIWGHVDCRRVLERFGESERSYWAARVHDLDTDELLRTQIVPPERTLSDEATLQVGGRRIELKFLGRGHTEHDIVVVLPDSDLVFAGDLLEEGSPPWFDDSWPLEWPAAVGELLRLGAASYVPGHGALMAPADGEAQQRDLARLAELADAVVSGRLDDAEARASSPFDLEQTEIALQRARETAGGQDSRGWERGGAES